MQFFDGHQKFQQRRLPVLKISIVSLDFHKMRVFSPTFGISGQKMWTRKRFSDKFPTTQKLTMGNWPAHLQAISPMDIYTNLV